MKNVKNVKLLILAGFFVLGCGVDPNTAKTKSETQTDAKGSQLTDGYLAVEGYVSPINLVINDKAYADSEDFYTQEVERLKLEVAKKYPQHKLYFDAAVGLRNFKYGLSAFLVAVDDVGVASEATVDSKGKFTFSLPPDTATEVPYLVRASKRLGLRLVNGNDLVSWCYNLSAEAQIRLDGKPFILRNFTTLITSYQCNEKSKTDITVPDNQTNEADETTIETETTETPETGTGSCAGIKGLEDKICLY